MSRSINDGVELTKTSGEREMTLVWWDQSSTFQKHVELPTKMELLGIATNLVNELKKEIAGVVDEG